MRIGDTVELVLDDKGKPTEGTIIAITATEVTVSIGAQATHAVCVVPLDAVTLTYSAPGEDSDDAIQGQ